MDEVYLVVKNERDGRTTIEAAYEDKLEAFQRAGSTPLEYVITLPLTRRTPTPSSSSTPEGGSAPATAG